MSQHERKNETIEQFCLVEYIDSPQKEKYYCLNVLLKYTTYSNNIIVRYGGGRAVDV